MQEAPPQLLSAAISAASMGAIQSVEAGKGSAPRGLLFTPSTTAIGLRPNSRSCKTHGEPPVGQKSTRFADSGQMARSTPRPTWPRQRGKIGRTAGKRQRDVRRSSSAVRTEHAPYDRSRALTPGRRMLAARHTQRTGQTWQSVTCAYTAEAV